MIAQEKHCDTILKSPALLGELIKKIDGTMSPDNILRHLQRASKNIRSNVALVQTLRDSGMTDEEIFEKKDFENDDR